MGGPELSLNQNNLITLSHIISAHYCCIPIPISLDLHTRRTLFADTAHGTAVLHRFTINNYPADRHSMKLKPHVGRCPVVLLEEQESC
jgi:hypothetical protein